MKAIPKRLPSPAMTRQITAWTGLSLTELARQLTNNHSPLDPHVAQTTLDDKPVVVIRHQDGSKLYVANTGVAYPLRGDYAGHAGGRIDISKVGAHFHITAPEHAVDIGRLLGRS
jgi:hypothetical protein